MTDGARKNVTNGRAMNNPTLPIAETQPPTGQAGADCVQRFVGRLSRVTLYHGNAEDIIPTLSNVDAVITDPPYSSGGQYRGDRTQKPSAKYVNADSQQTCRVDFAGDNRDQRAFLAWASMWLRDCHAAAKPGAVLMIFTDWRQLPTMTDALQCGGWVWRNLVTWWKPGVRMQRGRFSSSAEYVLYGSIGVPVEGQESPQNVLQYQPVSGEDKEHVAEKPVELMQNLVSVTPERATVLDPFMGSGTTAIACIRGDRDFIGIEKDERHYQTAVERIRRELNQGVML